MANGPKKGENSASEEASAFGQRVKGSIKEGWGEITGDEDMEREGEEEKAEGRARQSENQVIVSSADTNRIWVIGTFRDIDSAERAYNSLSSRGYTRDDINLLMSDETRKKYFDGLVTCRLASYDGR